MRRWPSESSNNGESSAIEDGDCWSGAELESLQREGEQGRRERGARERERQSRQTMLIETERGREREREREKEGEEERMVNRYT